MSLNIPLKDFAQTTLTSIFKSQDRQSFEKAYSDFIASNPTSIVVNGELLTSDQYKERLWKEKSLETGAQVRFLGTVADPAGHGVSGGQVGAFVNATIDEEAVVSGASQTHTVTQSLNMLIREDPTKKPSIIGVPFDGRRVFALTAVSASHPDAVSLSTTGSGTLQ